MPVQTSARVHILARTVPYMRARYLQSYTGMRRPRVCDICLGCTWRLSGVVWWTGGWLVRAGVDDSLFSGLLTGGVFGFSLFLSLLLFLFRIQTHMRTYSVSLSLPSPPLSLSLRSYVRHTQNSPRSTPGDGISKYRPFWIYSRNSIPYMHTQRYTWLAETDSDRANDAAGIGCSLSHL